MDEQIQGYSHLLDEETGKLPRSDISRLRVHHTGTVRPIGIGSKAEILSDSLLIELRINNRYNDYSRAQGRSEA